MTEAIDDGWPIDEEVPGAPDTLLIKDPSRSIISYNDSPDIPFDRSINPYRGCEHGCVYCYARPTHAWLDMSPGIDFETRIVYKPDAALLLRQALDKPGYQCRPMGLGTNTDPWQPAERKLGITRSIIEVLKEYGHPLAIVTKSSGIERDIDLLAEMATRDQVLVHVSIASLDADLCRKLEPRAATPSRRLRIIEKLAKAGIPVGVIVAPIIPVLSDIDIETVLESARNAGASHSHYILIRLPLEVAPLFREWLQTHYPLKAEHVMNRIRDTRNGADYQSGFGQRMRGSGVFAELIANRFASAYRRYQFTEETPLDCAAFAPPGSGQLSLF
ncbi:MAG: radical SAM protein [marine bacterium B5-7]|nr:MAG: radical SAM protein [marine bacterium B5-7]